MFLKRWMTMCSLLLLTACGPTSFEITIEGRDDMTFDERSFRVEAGTKVKVTLKNVGKLPIEAMGHNFVLLERGVSVMKFGTQLLPNKASIENQHLPVGMRKQVIVFTKILGPGQSETVEFTAPAPGNYNYVCTFPGHFATMNGVMLVY